MPADYHMDYGFDSCSCSGGVKLDGQIEAGKASIDQLNSL